jgi:hypothetical protein
MDNGQLEYGDVLASALLIPRDPKCYEEAMSSPEASHWREAIAVER